MRAPALLVAIVAILGGCGEQKSAPVAAATPTASATAPTPDQPATTPTPAPAAAAAPAAATDDQVARFASMAADAPGTAPSGKGPQQPKDREGAGDHPAIPRFAGAWIVKYDQKNFDRTSFAMANQDVTVEGRVTNILYQLPRENSVLEVWRNYKDFLDQNAFTTVFSCELEACTKRFEASTREACWPGCGSMDAMYYAVAYRQRDGLRASIFVRQGGEGAVQMRIVEPKAMTKGLQLVDAAGIGRDVTASGKAVLYAVQFDTDKATLRPESGPQLAAIAEWLKGNRARALIVGHTDGNGALGYNLTLSQRRAEAVVNALARDYGIPSANLSAFGAGMAAPVATNRTPEGQARNRRVEIVEMTR